MMMTKLRYQMLDAGKKLAGLRGVLDKIMAEKARIKTRLVELQRTAEVRILMDSLQVRHGRGG